MKNLSLAKKTFIGYGVAMIILIVFSIMAINAQRTIADKYDSVYDTYTQKCIDVGTFTKDYKELESLLSSYAYAADDGVDLSALTTDITDLSETCSKELDDLIESIPKADENGQAKKSLENVQQYLNDGTDAFKQIMTLVSQKKYTQAMSIYDKSIKSVSSDVDEEVSNVSKYFNDKSDSGRKSVDTRNERSTVILVIIAVVCIIALICIAATFTRFITKPIKALTERAESISKGDISGEKIVATTNDELGQMINSFNEVVDRMKREVNVANEVANGNLSMQINPKSPADELGQAFKLMVDSNNKTLGNIKESAYQVGAGAQQVAIASQSLAQGSTEQASAIQQVTSSITEVTSRTKQNAEEAREAESLVNQAKEEAVAGTDEMNRMMSAMQDITESSENISKIIKTIDDIAFQTNILALNAAVEAARAGEHGKGFAVVAEEVRNLAAKSAAAASETAEMIEDSIEKTQNGSVIASETSAKLEAIASNVEEIVKIVANIAESSNEQAIALGQIDEAVGQVSSVVQNNSATSEQCAAASEELSNQAQNLKVLLGNYNLKNNAGMIGSDFNNAAGKIGAAASTAQRSDSFGTAGNIGVSNTVSSVHRIPDASEFAGKSNFNENESIISLEDNGYSKY
ncbi:HAMP domain-containing protein [Eubacterium sp. MSJ-13]|uniref:methyl-accepting chemotaxis protein n=1 Tax=Eubacterium sp. MSJ-13 TaxID=2841513 RepID=UPI001C126959|nr:methyl-accepting chemotaxis protein [Eubacterium sp. MSJ-13]MBU5479195.1 HAMP domain-containing protein [Eubacterium sp. MSJ-13]